MADQQDSTATILDVDEKVVANGWRKTAQYITDTGVYVHVVGILNNGGVICRPDREEENQAVVYYTSNGLIETDSKENIALGLNRCNTIGNLLKLTTPKAYGV
jgi:hypothetical protein